MQIETINISELTPYENNAAKRHSSSLSATNNNTVKYECLYTNKG